MGMITDALYESFGIIEEDFKDEVLDSAEESIKKNEYIDEAIGTSIWDKIKDYINESLINESSSGSIEKAIEQYQDLLRQDIPPEKAKAMVVGKEKEQEGEIQESLTESKRIMDVKTKYDPDAYMKKVVEQYRKAAKFSLEEELTEEKLKNEDWRIKNIAMRAAIPSSALREALLKGM